MLMQETWPISGTPFVIVAPDLHGSRMLLRHLLRATQNNGARGAVSQTGISIFHQAESL